VPEAGGFCLLLPAVDKCSWMKRQKNLADLLVKITFWKQIATSHSDPDAQGLNNTPMKRIL